MNTSYTKGPWYFNEKYGTGDTLISTTTNHELDSEVLGVSEWVRAKDEDLKLMSFAPMLIQALALIEEHTVCDWSNKIAKEAINKALGKT